MDIEEIRQYCLAKKGVTESFPFNETTLVFKVMGKMFALMGLDNDPLFVNLKCDSEKAIELREQYSGVKPGYHMNKQLWNSVYPHSGEFSKHEFLGWIDHSYDLIVASLPKKKREELANL